MNPFSSALTIVISYMIVCFVSLTEARSQYAPLAQLCSPCYPSTVVPTHVTGYVTFNTNDGTVMETGPATSNGKCSTFVDINVYQCDYGKMSIEINSLCVTCSGTTSNDFKVYLRNILLRIMAPDDPLGIFGPESTTIVNWIGSGCFSFSTCRTTVTPSKSLMCISKCFCEYPENRTWSTPLPSCKQGCCALQALRVVETCSTRVRFVDFSSAIDPASCSGDLGTYVSGLACSVMLGVSEMQVEEEVTADCRKMCMLDGIMFDFKKKVYIYETP